MAEPVVVMLDRGRVDPRTPVLRATDRGVLHGDGVFETMHVRGGEPWLLAEHLTRMAGSADRLGLDLPDQSTLRRLAATALVDWPADQEGALRLVCTRGPEDSGHGDGGSGEGGPPTVYATLAPVPERSRRQRSAGLRVATATLGLAIEVRPRAPWLLGGVKALSYAVNMASLRWAAAQAMDDVLWLSAEGYALEAPTSSLLWQQDDTLYTVPAEATGVLPGITVGWLLDHASELGLRAARRLIRPAELTQAQGVWLISSVRGLAVVRELADTELEQSPDTPAIRDLLGHPH